MMYFIHIATYADAEDFTSWLDGQNKIAFNDSEEFKIWLDGQNIFPLQIYINGTTIEFSSKLDLEYFYLGFDTAMGLKLKHD